MMEALVVPTCLRIFLAGSWRNEAHAPVLAALRAAGHLVFDYRENNEPFELSIHPGAWSVEQFVAAHRGSAVRARFREDRAAIEMADAAVLLITPDRAGRASHAEFGYAAGIGKPTVIYAGAGTQPETSYLWAAALVADTPALLRALDAISADARVTRLGAASRSSSS
jgi:nucleoside 2-deoxyribosyltransferase